MSKIIKKDDVKRIQVVRDDGSVWTATVDDDGRLQLVSEVEPPKSPSSGSESEESSSPPPEPKSTPTASETPPESDPFSSIKPEGSSIEEIMGDLPSGGKGATPDSSRADQPEEIPEIPKDVQEKLKDGIFRHQLSNVMLDNKYDRMLRGRTRGKLDMTRLYKVPTQARNVFKQKQARRGKVYNVLLLVDESGSMSGSKARTAAECTVFLAKAFEGININVAIIGFNSIVTTRKEFNSPADYDRIYESIRTMNFRKGAGANNDWDALNKAYQMFNKAPEGENILIMMSDGEPASEDDAYFVDIKGNRETSPKGTDTLSNYERDSKTHLHHLVKANAHRVTSIGIGIKEGGWQIPNYEVVSDLNDLKPTIIKQLRKHITRG